MGVLDRIFGFFGGNTEGEPATEPTQVVAQEKPIAQKKPEIQMGIPSSVPIYPEYSQVVGEGTNGMDVASYMKKLADEEEQRIINMAANVPEKTLPADYYSTSPQPAIQGYTSGVTGVNMPIIGSPIAQKYPYALADERRRSLLNAAIIRQERNRKANEPMRVNIPQTYQGWQPKHEEAILKNIQDLSVELANTPNGLEQMRNPNTPLGKRVAELQYTINATSTYGREMAERAIEIQGDPKAPEWQKDIANNILNDPEFLLKPKNINLGYGLTKFPDYSAILNTQADQLLQSLDKEYEGNISFKSTPGGGVIAILPKEVQQVKEARIQQMADRIFNENRNLISYANAARGITDEKQLREIVLNDLRMLLGKQEEQKYMGVNMPTNINIGDKVEPKSYVAAYNNFTHQGNFDAIKNTILEAATQGGTPKDIKTNMFRIGDLKNERGESFVQSDLTEDVKPNTAVTYEMFPGQQISFGGKEQTWSLKDAFDKLSVQNPQIASEIEKQVKSGKLKWDEPVIAIPTKVKGAPLRYNTNMPITYQDMDNWRADGNLETLMNMAESGMETTYVLKPKNSGTVFNFGTGTGTKEQSPSATIRIYTPLKSAGGKLAFEALFDPNDKTSRKYTVGSNP